MFPLKGAAPRFPPAEIAVPRVTGVLGLGLPALRRPLGNHFSPLSVSEEGTSSLVEMLFRNLKFLSSGPQSVVPELVVSASLGKLSRNATSCPRQHHRHPRVRNSGLSPTSPPGDSETHSESAQMQSPGIKFGQDHNFPH